MMHRFRQHVALLATFALIATLTFLIVPAAHATTVYNDYYGPYGGDPFTTWDEDYSLNNKSHATPPFMPVPSFGGCYIAQGSTLLDDLDCDKVPDIVDNCLGVANPDQLDQNQNGIGDSCDLFVDSVVIDPPVVLEDRPFITTATLTNYRPYDLRNIELTMQVPELGLEQKVYVDTLAQGDQGRYEFFLRVPGCAKSKEYDGVLMVEFPKSPGVKESFYIPTRFTVKSNGLCEEEPTVQGKSLITILDIQDIDPAAGGVYPFSITNNEQESQAYVLSVQDIDWGSYLIEPRSLIVVPAGETREGRLTVYANKGVTGKHSFFLTLKSKDDAQQVSLTASVKDQAPGLSTNAFVQFGVFIVGAIILIVAAALMLHRAQRKK